MKAAACQHDEPPKYNRSYSPRWSHLPCVYPTASCFHVLGFLLLTGPLWFSVISNCQGLQENHVTQQVFFSSASGFAWFWPVLYIQVCSRSVAEGCNLSLLFKYSAHTIPCRLTQTCTSHCGWPGYGVWCNKHDPIVMMSLGSNRTFYMWENTTRWASL